MVYLLVPLVLAGAALGLGWYTNVIDQSTLQKIPYVQDWIPQSATPTIAEVTEPEPVPEQTEAFTLREMIGDPDAPMPELLQNMARERENLNQLAQELAEREKSLRVREEQLEQQEERISQMIQSASEQIDIYNNLKEMREEALKSGESKREVDIATALAKAKRSKDIPQMLIDLYNSQDVIDTEEAEKNKMLVLRIIHRYPEKERTDLFTNMAKADTQTASAIVKDFITTSTEDLYGITKEKAAASIENSTGIAGTG
jgi:hypothetical protein